LDEFTGWRGQRVGLAVVEHGATPAPGIRHRRRQSLAAERGPQFGDGVPQAPIQIVGTGDPVPSAVGVGEDFAVGYVRVEHPGQAVNLRCDLPRTVLASSVKTPSTWMRAA
jgi:hypothetical protein